MTQQQAIIRRILAARLRPGLFAGYKMNPIWIFLEAAAIAGLLCVCNAIGVFGG